MWTRVFLFLVIARCCACAATINAASTSSSDVQTALNSASAGDTVVIPAGSSSWTSSVSLVVPANVTVVGAGTSATGGGDQTVITDNIAGGTPLITFTITNGGVFRLSGITFQSGTGGTKDGGTVTISGPGTIRIDHCRFNMTSSANYKTIALYNGVFGVMDHCILDLWELNAIYAYNGRSGSWESQGNYEWTLPTGFGSADYFFVEDNIITGYTAGTVYPTRIFDGFTAARMVVRFNTVTNACLSEAHATGHAPNDRGPRSQELYCNAVYGDLAKDPNFNLADFSSGTALGWGNSADQVYKNMFLFRVTRSDNTTYSQTATPDGWGYAGTNFNGTGSSWDGGTALGTALGTGYPALDQPGRGMGALLTNDFPNKINLSTGTLYWPTQALEPIYIWQNTGTIVSGWGGSYYNANTRVVSDRDYYAQASGIQTAASSPFNGTSGTGWGTLANRPTTCTTGVGYWANDQGSWNQSTTNYYGVQMNGADGVLYLATATDTWTQYYTPYTYPHPLRGEGAGTRGPRIRGIRLRP